MALGQNKKSSFTKINVLLKKRSIVILVDSGISYIGYSAKRKNTSLFKT